MDYCLKFGQSAVTLHYIIPFGGLRATYAVHLRLTGMLVVDFLFVLVELFCQVLWLRHYDRILIGNWHF